MAQEMNMLNLKKIGVFEEEVGDYSLRHSEGPYSKTVGKGEIGGSHE